MSTRDHQKVPLHIHVLAGGVGGTVSAVVTCPLEVVKTRLQSSTSASFLASTQHIPNTPANTSKHTANTSKHTANTSKHTANTSKHTANTSKHTANTSKHTGGTLKDTGGTLKGTGRSAFKHTPSPAGNGPNAAGNRGIYRLATARLLRSIAVNEGVRGLFRGFVPTVLGVGPTRALYFGVYNGAKRTLVAGPLGDSTASHAAAAACAGFASYTFGNPIWLVKTRLQVQNSVDGVAPAGTAARATAAVASSSSSSSSLSSSSSSSSSLHPGISRYSGTWDAVRTIYAKEGLRGFFQGVSASYLGISEGVIQFVLYEKFKSHFLDATAPPIEDEMVISDDDIFVGHAAGKGVETSALPSLTANPRASHSGHSAAPRADPAQESGPLRFAIAMAVASGSAKVIASAITYPHEVLRTRLREQTRPIGVPVSSLKYQGLTHAIRTILKTEGVMAFYSGLGAHLLRVAPSSAVLFVSYEAVSQAYLKFFQS